MDSPVNSSFLLSSLISRKNLVIEKVVASLGFIKNWYGLKNNNEKYLLDV